MTPKERIREILFDYFDVDGRKTFVGDEPVEAILLIVDEAYTRGLVMGKEGQIDKGFLVPKPKTYNQHIFQTTSASNQLRAELKSKLREQDRS